MQTPVAAHVAEATGVLAVVGDVAQNGLYSIGALAASLYGAAKLLGALADVIRASEGFVASLRKKRGAEPSTADTAPASPTIVADPLTARTNTEETPSPPGSR